MDAVTAGPRTATPATARAINDRLALDLLLQRGALTAAELRDLTGLSRPTISELLARLQEAGLVAMVGESNAVRRGPNARLYELLANRAHVAAVDVRKDRAAIAVADLRGATLAATEQPVGDPARSPVGTTIEALLATVDRAGDGALHTLAVGAPGLIDPATGQLRATIGLPRWHGELVAALRARLKVPVLLENEVNLAAVAEMRLGAARDRDTFALLWLGESIGGAAILDGQLRRGASGGAGELGFLPVPGAPALPSATDCSNGYHGLASSAAVCALARKHGIETAGDDDVVAAEGAVRAARAAGRRGELFLDELAGNVAVGAAAICVVLDPGCLVLGGEVGRAGGGALANRVAARLAGISPVRTEVRAAEVPGSAVLAGAVLVAQDAAQADLFGPRVPAAW